MRGAGNAAEVRHASRRSAPDDGRARAIGSWSAVGACVLASMLLVSAARAGSGAGVDSWGCRARAQVISGLLGGIGHVIGGTVGKLAVTAFDAIIHALFAPIAHFINTQLIGWLVAVPDYAPAGSHVAATEQTVLAMAGAALGAVATISIARFWVGRVRGQRRLGARGPGPNRRRGVVAADLAVDVPHRGRAGERASTGLLGSGSVTKSSANLLAVGRRRGRRAGVPRRRAVREAS